MSDPWKVSDIADMQEERVQFAHVAKHLYNLHEHWEHVVPDLGDPRCSAWEAGCSPAELSRPQQDCYRVTDQCRQHVLHDHDKVLAPAYRQALVEADLSRRSGKLGDNRGWVFVGDLGVIVIVREVGRPSRAEVKTAYRVHPRPGAGAAPEDFLKAAVRKLRDKTSWISGGL
jgi:hypothetical protein